jgi:hypothetical protein
MHGTVSRSPATSVEHSSQEQRTLLGSLFELSLSIVLTGTILSCISGGTQTWVEVAKICTLFYSHLHTGSCTKENEEKQYPQKMSISYPWTRGGTASQQ